MLILDPRCSQPQTLKGFRVYLKDEMTLKSRGPGVLYPYAMNSYMVY